MAAQTKELGAAGTAYFTRQFEKGEGNYVAERVILLEGITLDETVENVHKLDNSQ